MHTGLARTSWIALFVLTAACDSESAADQPQAGASKAGATASGGAGHAGHAGGAGDAPDAGEGLTTGASAALATAGVQLLVQGPRLGLQLTEADVTQDAAVIAMHQEFYGIPWQAFEKGSAPPKEWSSLLDEQAAGARAAGRPVFLSISMLNGARERLAATTRIESGQVKTDDASSAPCYDFASAPDAATKKSAYLRYVDDMVARFEPRFLTIAIEVNLFFEKCPAATPGLSAFLAEVYTHVKQQRPTLAVFPSFQIDHLYGYSDDSCPDATQRDACFERAYAQIKDIPRDRFAMSSYPFLSGIGKVDMLPADWFERGARRQNERPVIAETGWLSTPLVARRGSQCISVFSFTESDSAAYLGKVLADAERLDMDLVTWWSDRDLVPSELMTDCPCSYDATFCSVLDIFRGPEQPSAPDVPYISEVLLKAFGSMGLRTYDGTPKAALLPLWTAVKGR